MTSNKYPFYLFYPYFSSCKICLDIRLQVIAFLLFFCSMAHAQQSITGKITDDRTGEPLPGATVIITGSGNGTSADAEGNFTLTSTPEFPFKIEISYASFKTKELELYEVPETPLHIKLQTENVLEEIVVVGYGTQERKNVVGSIAKVEARDTKIIPVASFDAQLQGRATGVQVNTFSGMPGEGVRVQVRGTASINASNDPLYVIDGVFVNNNSLASIDLGSKKTSPLADINPADIENIEVLKDASAIAIYGSRGSNGVILVTTKRGDYNAQKPIFNFNASYGWQWADPNKLWKLTTGPEHATIVNEQWINSGKDNPKLNQTYENRPFRPVSEVINGVPGRGNPEDQQTYDKLSEVFRTAHVQNYDFNLSGGSTKIRYFAGIGYTDQEAILRPARFQRASAKFNFDTRLSERITFSSSNGVYQTFRQQVRGGAGQDAGHLLAALHSPTYLPIYNPDGTLARGSLYENVINLTNTEAVDISTRSIRYIGNQFIEARILPGLLFKTSVGLDYNNYNEQEYFNNLTQIGGNTFPGGYKNNVLTNFTIFQNEQTLSYLKTIAASHNFNFLIGNGIQSTNSTLTSATGYGFPNNSFRQISSAANRTSGQVTSRSTISSFFGRVNYNLQEKYYLEVAFRADGSSKFGANNRWGYFPAVAAAWRIKKERFLSGIELLSDLKLRASAGQAGNQNGINDYAAQGLWSGNAQYPDNLTSGPRPGIAPFQLSNPDLQWETTTTYNAGIDLGLLNNRILVDFNVYYKYTSDALLNLPVPQSTGYSSILANAGDVSNRGVELGIYSVNIQKKDFQWTTSVNFSKNKNRAEKLPYPITFEAREYIRAEEGAALGSYWLYKQLYVNPETGDAVFEDVNKDNKIDAKDRLLLGNIYPKHYGGITNTFNYKNFDLSVFFSYQYGNSVFNFNKYIMEGGGTRDASRSILASQLERWTHAGQVTNTPRVTSVGNNYNIEQNSRYLEDGSFLRLKSVSFGYTLPASLTSKVKIEKLRVYFLGTNLWLLTKYTGPDPESSGSAIPNLQGLDTATPPQPIGIQFGTNITF